MARFFHCGKYQDYHTETWLTPWDKDRKVDYEILHQGTCNSKQCQSPERMGRQGFRLESPGQIIKVQPKEYPAMELRLKTNFVRQRQIEKKPPRETRPVAIVGEYSQKAARPVDRAIEYIFKTQRVQFGELINNDWFPISRAELLRAWDRLVP